MAASEDQSSTLTHGDATSFVTTLTDGPNASPPVSTVEDNQETRPVASTLEEDSPAAVLPPAESVLGLGYRDCLVLFVLFLVCLGLSVWHWGRLSGWGMTPVEVDRLPERVYDYRIDINEAGYAEWLGLPGVGETLADRIIRYREEHGPFQSIDELDDIKGIGPKTLEKLRPWLIVRQLANEADSNEAIRESSF